MEVSRSRTPKPNGDNFPKKSQSLPRPCKPNCPQKRHRRPCNSLQRSYDANTRSPTPLRASSSAGCRSPVGFHRKDSNYQIEGRNQSSAGELMKGKTGRLKTCESGNLKKESGECSVSYFVYVFLHQDEIDKEIFPFESRRCVREILEESSDDDRRKRIAKAALKDRRLIKVELSTGCKIELGGLTGAENCFRGLPRRRLNITGPSYVKIVHALTMLEEFFPRLMRDIICPYPLPAGTTTKYETVNRMASTAYYHINHQIGGTGLRGQLNDRPFLTCKQLRETLQGD
uniref:Uncharacterized protein n=1 Tax=Mesocestoides corti TaxID=53468 RepID=A0A5K3EXC8_MESCO